MGLGVASLPEGLGLHVSFDNLVIETPAARSMPADLAEWHEGPAPLDEFERLRAADAGFADLVALAGEQG